MVARGQAMVTIDEKGILGNGCRKWLRDWLAHEETVHGGPMVAIVGRFWLDQKGMYTCEQSFM